MVRLSVLAAGAAVVVGAAFVTGAMGPSNPPRPLVGPPRPDEKVVAVVGQRVGFFNMAGVMREYNRAKTAVARLNDRRVRMSANLVGMRAMYVEAQQTVQKTTDAALREELSAAMLLLTRRIEDDDREINKLLDRQASQVIVGLYDEIRATVVDLARERGLVAVFAYPAPVTPQEAESPVVKELMLKPPAAQPFYLDPAVDYTDEIVRRLNARPADDGD
jgi:Skp family chaperone for outer membrane proteins